MSPFTSDRQKQIRSIGEKELIRSIRTWLGDASPALPRGIGDDCAAVPSSPAPFQLLTVDSLVHGRHFDESASPEAAGSKLVKRNLSDIAAMGGIPRHALVSLVTSGDLSLDWIARFFDGIRATALAYHMEINGGDLSEADGTQFSATLCMTGECQRPVPRQGGRDSSGIWITGSLGGSRDGHHLTFTPRIAEGEWLGRQDWVLAMMDLTDGVRIDLPAMVPEGLQARIDPTQIPVSEAAKFAATQSNQPPVWHALTDGEDYELIFFTDPSTEPPEWEKRWAEEFKTPVKWIGTLATISPSPTGSENKLVNQDGNPLFEGGGFEHFHTP